MFDKIVSPRKISVNRFAKPKVDVVIEDVVETDDVIKPVEVDTVMKRSYEFIEDDGTLNYDEIQKKIDARTVATTRDIHANMFPTSDDYYVRPDGLIPKNQDKFYTDNAHSDMLRDKFRTIDTYYSKAGCTGYVIIDSREVGVDYFYLKGGRLIPMARSKLLESESVRDTTSGSYNIRVIYIGTKHLEESQMIRDIEFIIDKYKSGVMERCCLLDF